MAHAQIDLFESEGLVIMNKDHSHRSIPISVLIDMKREMTRYVRRCREFGQSAALSPDLAARLASFIEHVELKQRECERVIQLRRMEEDDDDPALLFSGGNNLPNFELGHSSAPISYQQQSSIPALTSQNLMHSLNLPFNIPSTHSGASFSLPSLQIELPSNVTIVPTHESHTLSMHGAAATASANGLPLGFDASIALCAPSVTTPVSSERKRLLYESYPDWVNQLVLPEQGTDVWMLPNPSQRYSLEKLIKSTLFGAIWLAKQSMPPQQLVAVKLSNWLRWQEANNEGSSENMMREMRYCQLLQPMPETMTRVIEVAYDSENHWIVMEFVSGGDLLDAINLHGSATEWQAWVMFRQLINALEHMHTRGLCHLDVSLENCLVTESLDLKLCDFGQTRPLRMSEQRTELPFARGSPMGAKTYCKPPEGYARMDFYGTRVDLYAAGIVLYYILTGSPPFAFGFEHHFYDLTYMNLIPPYAGSMDDYPLLHRYFCGIEDNLRRLSRTQNQRDYPPECNLCCFNRDLGVTPNLAFSDNAPRCDHDSPVTQGAAEVLARLLCWPDQRTSMTGLNLMPWLCQEPPIEDEDEVDGGAEEGGNAENVSNEGHPDWSQQASVAASDSNQYLSGGPSTFSLSSPSSPGYPTGYSSGFATGSSTGQSDYRFSAAFSPSTNYPHSSPSAWATASPPSVPAFGYSSSSSSSSGDGQTAHVHHQHHHHHHDSYWLEGHHHHHPHHHHHQAQQQQQHQPSQEQQLQAQLPQSFHTQQFQSQCQAPSFQQ